jgi:hypothetical protein
MSLDGAGPSASSEGTQRRNPGPQTMKPLSGDIVQFERMYTHKEGQETTSDWRSCLYPPGFYFSFISDVGLRSLP